MEFLAHKQAFTYLLTETLMNITAYVTDRHGSITKWMREECPGICKKYGKPVVKHFFDCWHVAKSLHKKLTKLSKIRGCEIIGEWARACINHFHWCVSTTKSGQENVIWEKFKSYLTHITGVHEDPSNKIFNKCAHGEIEQPRNWFSKSIIIYCN